MGTFAQRRFGVTASTRYAVSRLTQYTFIVVGLLVAFQLVGIDLTVLAVMFGFLGVGIGFGFQTVTSNFVAGIVMLLEKPVSPDDRITVGNVEGDVERIKIRSTVVRSTQNVSIIVPNSAFITEHVINWSHGDPKVAIIVEVGVAYDSDLALVVDTLTQIAIDHPEVLVDPPPQVRFASFGDSAWNMKLIGWIEDPKEHARIESDVRMAIVPAFRMHKIEIPVPQHDLHVRAPDILRTARKQSTRAVHTTRSVSDVQSADDASWFGRRGQALARRFAAVRSRIPGADPQLEARARQLRDARARQFRDARAAALTRGRSTVQQIEGRGAQVMRALRRPQRGASPRDRLRGIGRALRTPPDDPADPPQAGD